MSANSVSHETPLAHLTALSDAVVRAEGLDARLRVALEGLERRFGYEHTMILVPEDQVGLVMLACRGYPGGGVGAEVRMGTGAVGVAAERRTPVRISNVSHGILMARAAQSQPAPTASIPFPGLVNVQSQLAVPALVEERLIAVLYAEDTRRGRFVETDVQLLQILANQLATHIFYESGDDTATLGPNEAASTRGPADLSVRYYRADGSIFFGDEYVIKSLPGRILYKLLREFRDTGRTEFTKKELRLDPELGLPAIRDNLDTRLILLRRRLEERFPFVCIEPSGRGRFSLSLQSPLDLQEMP